MAHHGVSFEREPPCSASWRKNASKARSVFWGAVVARNKGEAMPGLPLPEPEGTSNTYHEAQKGTSLFGSIPRRMLYESQ
ncbi:hypothetical protein ANI02nite_27440 [Acetobacter nitrogenifigens DSM 23921 = NBRC 105050]|uniref:Uncharacterized protein n=1 Tax=Acetobacter nitrogenifigens DSM 23921 = NBRC 105050 TaxID=1120919 RepID=A0A511XD33_9PROT|nr:hypothetical protein ANI02nite_27440 [Acetobacter nitrogenifigens DSM 23921 = NBRC 105050]